MITRTDCLKRRRIEIDEERVYYDGHLINFSSGTGYPTIWDGKQNKLLHRYIWEKYNGEIPEGYQIHHKDKNRKNYDLDNLELVDVRDHHRKHALENNLGKSNKGKPKNHASGFCEKPVPIIATKGNETLFFESISEASRKLNINTSMISSVVNGRRKTTKGWCFNRAG